MRGDWSTRQYDSAGRRDSLRERHNRVSRVSGIRRRAVRQLKFADTTGTKFFHCVGNELMKCRHYLPEVSLNDHGGWFLGAQLVGRYLPPRTCAYVCHFPPALLQNNNRLFIRRLIDSKVVRVDSDKPERQKWRTIVRVRCRRVTYKCRLWATTCDTAKIPKWRSLHRKPD